MIGLVAGLPSLAGLPFRRRPPLLTGRTCRMKNEGQNKDRVVTDGCHRLERHLQNTGCESGRLLLSGLDFTIQRHLTQNAMMPQAKSIQTHRHLWVVGILSLLWNAFGAFDYLMTQLQVEAYMAAFTGEQLAYFYGFPAWVDAAWTVGVWGSVAGSVGLLLRKRWAMWAFAASIAGLVGTSTYTMLLTDGMAVMGGVGVLVFSIIVWLLAVALFVYAWAMARRNVLT